MSGRRAESLSPDDRLRRRADFQRCYQQGRRRHGSLAILYGRPNDHGRPRLGITATRKLGNAVVRHRLKRRAREIYRRWGKRSALPAIDLVVHLRPAAREASFAELDADLIRLLRGFLPDAGQESSRGCC